MKARLVAARFMPGSDRELPRDGICCVEVEVQREGAGLLECILIGQDDDEWGQRLREGCLWDERSEDWVGWLQDRAEEVAVADVFRVAGAIYGANKQGFLRLPGGARVPIAEAVVPSPRLEIYCRMYAHPGCWDAYEDDD